MDILSCDASINFLKRETTIDDGFFFFLTKENAFASQLNFSKMHLGFDVRFYYLLLSMEWMTHPNESNTFHLQKHQGAWHKNCHFYVVAVVRNSSEKKKKKKKEMSIGIGMTDLKFVVIVSCLTFASRQERGCKCNAHTICVSWNWQCEESSNLAHFILLASRIRFHFYLLLLRSVSIFCWFDIDVNKKKSFQQTCVHFAIFRGIFAFCIQQKSSLYNKKKIFLW